MHNYANDTMGVYDKILYTFDKITYIFFIKTIAKNRNFRYIIHRQVKKIL